MTHIVADVRMLAAELAFPAHGLLSFPIAIPETNEPALEKAAKIVIVAAKLWCSKNIFLP
jgi:hypothetical protein